MLVIGLTGSIGTGKSEAARQLEALGASIISADQVGHEAYTPNTEAWEQVVVAFGDDILQEDGEIDRKKLGAVVFSDPGQLDRLNQIMHPRMARMVSDKIEVLRGQGVGVVVVEAGMRSGSLITAREASDRGREVMAVPGSPLDPRSLGCNSLIRDGATLVVSARDVIENLRQPELSIPPSKPWSAQSANDDTSAPADITKARDKLKEFLGYEATEVDELIRQCHLSPGLTHSALLEMELAGEVMRHFGNRVSRVYES